MKRQDYMKNIYIEKELVENSESTIKALFNVLRGIDIDTYVEYLYNYNWVSYFRYRRFTFQKYGYFVWKKDWQQILFQFIRPCKFLTNKLYKVTGSYPSDFFHHHYEWERENLLKRMVPRCREVLEHIDEYIAIYELLCDENSRQCLLYIILGCVTLKYEYFTKAKHVEEKVDYYPEDIFVSKPRVVVDCGGYTGDTAAQYLKEFGKEIEVYYFIEPDEKNINEAQRIMKDYKNKMVYIQAAVSERDGITNFSANGAAGTIDADGSKEVKLIVLDQALGEGTISFIKMDVEGTEFMALQGAKKRISNERPDMAICAYHKAADIRELVTYVKSLCPEYKVYLRHYSDKEKETVLYFTVN